MRPQFNDNEYAAGFEHMRAAMVEGLGKVDGDRHAGSFVIGAFCAVVRLAWEGRDPGMTRIQIAAVLATVAGVLLRADALRHRSERLRPVPPRPRPGAVLGPERRAGRQRTLSAPRDRRGPHMIPQPFPPAEPEAERLRNPPLRHPGQYALRAAKTVARGRAAHAAGLPRTAVPYGAQRPDLRQHWFKGWDEGFCEQLAKARPKVVGGSRTRRTGS